MQYKPRVKKKRLFCPSYQQSDQSHHLFFWISRNRASEMHSPCTRLVYKEVYYDLLEKEKRLSTSMYVHLEVDAALKELCVTTSVSPLHAYRHQKMYRCFEKMSEQYSYVLVHFIQTFCCNVEIFPFKTSRFAKPRLRQTIRASSL